MTTYGRLPKTQAPARTTMLPRGAFADEYDRKPKGDVEVGLRLLSEADIQTAKAEASRYAERLYPDGRDILGQVDAYNDALVRWVVGRGCCLPKDVTQSYFREEEETVRRALTSAGARSLFEQLEVLQAELSPLREPATDEAVSALVAKLCDGVIATIPEHKQRRVRKLLTFVIEEIGANV